ncbi:MAG: hypothetical protein U1F66_00410 [bacterium]
MSLLRSILACLLLCSGIARARADAPTSRAPESQPELTQAESAPAGPYGQIIFFPAVESRPADERFKVSAGQQVPVCVKLSAQASAYVDRLQDRSIGYLLLMEDAAEPPHRLAITFGNRLKSLKPSPDGCYGGDWRIPDQVVPGNYQVSDLLWMARDESFYSLRNYLYEFSKVEELEVLNPKADSQAPKLLAIKTYKKSPQTMQNYSGVLRVKLEQRFDFEDPESGIKKNSLRVFYSMAVDGTTVDLLDAKCRSIPQTNRSFRCTLQVTNPEIIWGLNRVVLTLHSLSIEDQAGNRLLLDGEAAIKERVPAAETVVVFERKKRLRDDTRFDLPKDPNIPPPRDF